MPLDFYCCNSNCPRAGWCKRISLGRNITPQEDNWDRLEYHTPDIEFSCYIPNKARLIRERENINDALTNEELERQEYSDTDRESGVRENNNPDTNAHGRSAQGDESVGNRVLQLQRSGNRGGQDEGTRSLELFTDANGHIDVDRLERHLEQEILACLGLL